MMFPTVLNEAGVLALTTVENQNIDSKQVATLSLVAALNQAIELYKNKVREIPPA